MFSSRLPYCDLCSVPPRPGADREDVAMERSGIAFADLRKMVGSMTRVCFCVLCFGMFVRCFCCCFFDHFHFFMCLFF